jgi:hypothetical protein
MRILHPTGERSHIHGSGVVVQNIFEFQKDLDAVESSRGVQDSRSEGNGRNP